MLSIDAWLDEKPYKEIFDGAIHEKVSPQLNHGIVAGAILGLLTEWAKGRGFVVPELRVHLEEGVTLVPDVAFLFHERLAGLSERARQTPPFAPDITVEVCSPDDREARIRRKTELYLRHGATIVLNVDPKTQTVMFSTAQGERILVSGDVIEHPTFGGLAIPVAEIFKDLA